MHQKDGFYAASEVITGLDRAGGESFAKTST